MGFPADVLFGRSLVFGKPVNGLVSLVCSRPLDPRR